MKDILNCLGQYTDDADIYSLYNQKSLDSIFLTLERFCSISGLTLNYDKTSKFRIGSLKKSDAMLLTQTVVLWTNKPINVLGVWVANDMDETIKLNYQSLQTKALAIMNSWSTRNSSLIGKVHIVNSLVSSLFVYRMMVLPHMKETMYLALKEAIIKFLWKGAKPKIDFDTLMMNKKYRGLGLCDLEIKDKALKENWVQICHNDKKLSNIV